MARRRMSKRGAWQLMASASLAKGADVAKKSMKSLAEAGVMANMAECENMVGRNG